MDSIEHQHQHHVSTNSRRGKWVFLGFTAVALFFLWTEHRAHFLGALPYLLVLSCPLMHLFHHGHGHHHQRGAEDASAKGTRIGEQAGERDAR